MIILAIKFNEDDYYSNDYYAKVGGVTNQEFNFIESEAYRLINYSLYIKNELYQKYEIYLKNYRNKTIKEKEYFDE
jgi:hypothetical protein